MPNQGAQALIEDHLHVRIKGPTGITKAAQRWKRISPTPIEFIYALGQMGVDIDLRNQDENEKLKLEHKT